MLFKHHLPFASSPARPLDKIGLIKEAVASFLRESSLDFKALWP
jgi:hypothetical protein